MSTTTTTRDRGDRYGPMEWAQLSKCNNAVTCLFLYSEERIPVAISGIHMALKLKHNLRWHLLARVAAEYFCIGLGVCGV